MHSKILPNQITSIYILSGALDVTGMLVCRFGCGCEIAQKSIGDLFSTNQTRFKNNTFIFILEHFLKEMAKFDLKYFIVINQAIAFNYNSKSLHSNRSIWGQVLAWWHIYGRPKGSKRYKLLRKVSIRGKGVLEIEKGI